MDDRLRSLLPQATATEDDWPVSERRGQGAATDEVASARLRVGVLWRGARGAERPAEDRGLGGLFDAFAAFPVDVVPVPFDDGRVEEVRAELHTLDGVLVWVNPIQDGATRRHVDELLWDAAANGRFVSAHPEVIAKLGTKQVLFETRHLGWGSDTSLYRSVDELRERLPARLERHRRLVVKQGRGNGGNGVWSVELAEAHAPITPDAPVHVREARAKDRQSERLSLAEFVRRCEPYFAWSGILVDQEYQRRLADGLVRCYLSHGEVLGFSHQWPAGLLDAGVAGNLADRGRPAMDGPDAAAHRRLRRLVEHQWVPEMASVLGLSTRDFPVIWDADFLFGDEDERGEDTYVLCEINVSAVWPFPPTASTTIAANTVARMEAVRRGPGA